MNIFLVIIVISLIFISLLIFIMGLERQGDADKKRKETGKILLITGGALLGFTLFIGAIVFFAMQKPEEHEVLKVKPEEHEVLKVKPGVVEPLPKPFLPKKKAVSAPTPPKKVWPAPTTSPEYYSALSTTSLMVEPKSLEEITAKRLAEGKPKPGFWKFLLG